MFQTFKNIYFFFILAYIWLLCVFLLNGVTNVINHFVKLFYQSNVTIRKVTFDTTLTVKLHLNNLRESIVFISVCH